jgi:murein DD-endopeptidase MepM/ murein hydrolase activator NlpD
MVRNIAKRRLRCVFFWGLLSAVAVAAAGCSGEASRFGESSNRNSYVARAPASQPAAVPMQPTRTAAVESQPLPQAQSTGAVYAPQYAALQYEQPQYPPPQYYAPPPAPQYVPPQPVPPPAMTPYAPPAPQYYPPPPSAPPYAPGASQYTPQSVPSYPPPAQRPAPAFPGAGGGAKVADAAAPRTPRSAAVPQAPAARMPGASASLPAAPAQAAMPTPVVGSSAQTLLPTPPVYTVGSGDTLGKVAHRYRVSVREIAVANGITPETPLKVGERLTIPVRTGVPPSAYPGKPQPSGPVVAQTRPAPQTYTAVPAAPSKVASSEIAANVRLASPVETPSAETAPNGAPGFRWPVRGRIINNFGARVNGSPNDGIDLALPEGTAVRAAEDGVVAYAGNELKGYGNLVLVRHANGFVTAYANGSELMVKRNDQVHKGQVILKSGQTGNAAAPQLHFEIRKNSAPVDPMQYLPTDKTASAPL